MAEYMLLLRGGGAMDNKLTPEEIQRLIQPYVDWSNKLRAEDRMIAGSELSASARMVRMNGDQVAIDGPYTETKEDIGGYFIIRADSDDDAARIACGCPVLGHGGFVEVRQVVEQ